MSTETFPDGFLWGTATAAHQIEGGNVNNDWWHYEHDPDTACVEPSGDACDSWNRWEEDLDLVAGLGLGAYRFSIEWSRIEPAEGEFSAASLDHYRRMCAGCHERGLVPVVTFHHFTTPWWLAERGGFEASDAPERFARMCERSVAALGDVVGMACTLNEPNIVSLMGYLAGYFPPKARDPERRRNVNDALCRSHRLAVDALRAGPGDFPVGLTVAMTDYQAVDGGEAKLDRIRRSMEDVFLESTGGDDFVGVQTYTRRRIGPEGALGNEDGLGVTQMGYEFYPEALEATIRRAHEVTGGLPAFVTENGISTDDDSERIEYVSRALAGVGRCLRDGLDVRGYFYWSLLDNFEWAFGYGPRFGLASVDRESFERSAKQSGEWLGAVARSNAIVLPG
ncbi:MAG: glycoside hydrolase family 1 protein [Acidimicrobiales bacterium]